jgi:hypothetical protein
MGILQVRIGSNLVYLIFPNGREVGNLRKLGSRFAYNGRCGQLNPSTAWALSDAWNGERTYNPPLQRTVPALEKLEAVKEHSPVPG